MRAASGIDAAYSDSSNYGHDGDLPDFEDFPIGAGFRSLVCRLGSLCKSILVHRCWGFRSLCSTVESYMFQVSPLWISSDDAIDDAFSDSCKWGVKSLIVWGFDLFLDLTHGTLLTAFVSVWALLIAWVVDGVIALIRMLFRRWRRRERFYFWPSAPSNCWLLCVQCISLLCNIGILACAREEPEGLGPSVGVQILQGFKNLNYFVALLVGVACLCRLREERAYPFPLPKGCKRRAGVRCRKKMRGRKALRWLSLFLLLNVCSAEALDVCCRTEWRLFSLDSLDAFESADAVDGHFVSDSSTHCDVVPCMPSGEPICTPSRISRTEGFRDTSRQIEFCYSFDK